MPAKLNLGHARKVFSPMIASTRLHPSTDHTPQRNSRPRVRVILISLSLVAPLRGENK